MREKITLVKKKGGGGEGKSDYQPNPSVLPLCDRGKVSSGRGKT